MLTLDEERQRFKQETEEAHLAKNSQKAYSSDWQQFKDYCFERNLIALPADTMTVALYLMHLYRDKARTRTTIARHLASINAMHLKVNFSGYSNVTAIKKVLKTIRVTDDYQAKQAPPLLLDTYNQLLDYLDLESLEGLRDGLLFSWLWFGAFRKSELLKLEFDDLLKNNDGRGFHVNLRGSKTNRDNSKKQQVRNGTKITSRLPARKQVYRSSSI